MHHGQSRGGNTRKVCKKQVNLFKTGGKFVKVRGKYNFRETGGKCIEIRNLWLMIKKKKIWREKLKFCRKSENFSEIGVKSETGGGNASWSQGDGRPCSPLFVYIRSIMKKHQ